MTLLDIEDIVASDANFEAYIEGRHSLQGQTLDLLKQAMTLGWEEDDFSDEALFTLIKDIIGANMHYEATHVWDD